MKEPSISTKRVSRDIVWRIACGILAVALITCIALLLQLSSKTPASEITRKPRVPRPHPQPTYNDRDWHAEAKLEIEVRSEKIEGDDYSLESWSQSNDLGTPIPPSLEALVAIAKNGDVFLAGIIPLYCHDKVYFIAAWSRWHAVSRRDYCSALGVYSSTGKLISCNFGLDRITSLSNRLMAGGDTTEGLLSVMTFLDGVFILRVDTGGKLVLIARIDSPSRFDEGIFMNFSENEPEGIVFPCKDIHVTILYKGQYYQNEACHHPDGTSLDELTGGYCLMSWSYTGECSLYYLPELEQDPQA